MDGMVILVGLVLALLGAGWWGRVIPKFQNRLDQRFPLDILTKDILEYLERKGVATFEEILQYLDEYGYSNLLGEKLSDKLVELISYKYIKFNGYSDEWKLLHRGYDALEKNDWLLKSIAIETGLSPQQYPSPEGLMD